MSTPNFTITTTRASWTTNMATCTTEYFDYDPDTKHFTAFESDLPFDAAAAFTLRSQWTGKEIVFECTDTLKDAEGDVQLWRYKPQDLSYSALSMTIYND